MEDVNDGSIPAVFLIQLLILKITQYSTLLIPISLFFGILIALNRLYVSNEMVIMKLNGYSNKLISSVLSKIIIITSIVVMLFNFFITPYTVELRANVEHRIVHEQKIYSLQERNFTISNDGSKIIYIDDIDVTKKSNVFIKYETPESTRIDISSNISDTDTDNNKIQLQDGISYVFDSDKGLSSTRYQTQNILLTNKVPEITNSSLESKSIFELFHYTDISSFSEISKRLSMIIATLVLGYLAIPLSHVNEKEDKYRNIFIAAIFYFSYIVLINIFTASLDTKFYIILNLISLHILYIFVTYKLYAYTNYSRN